MYDNQYPNADPASRKEDYSVQNQEQSQSRNVYNGQDASGYYRNTYQNQNYTRGTTNNPYENRTGYYGYNGAANNTENRNHASGMGSTSGMNRTGTYQYGESYPNDYTQADRSTHKKKTTKKFQGKGYFKKVLVSVSLGLFFGVCAGLGIYVVQYVTGMSGQNSAQESAIETQEAMAADVQTKVDEILSEANKTVDDIKAESGLHMTDNVSTVVTDVSEVVSEAMPAIVSINNHYTEKMSFFGEAIVNEAEASGSGIIVGQNDTELLIATNYHVVAGADKLTVQFTEGSEAEASVKGTDAEMDLAVIAVQVKNVDSKTMQEIAVATLGNSDSLVVGEPAIAIGNSLGYGQSVTVGVISALNRTISLSDGSDGTFIQTDAAINPGNSGGALLNMKGEVIGINSNKIGGSAVEGMGYAIPISSASPIIAELMLKETKNKVAEDERGYLGISGITVTQYVSETYGMPEGVYISQVYDNTAASKAGLRKGDIITEFDGEKIASMDELQKELEFHAIGDTVEITVMFANVNGYENRKVQLTLGNKVSN